MHLNITLEEMVEKFWETERLESEENDTLTPQELRAEKIYQETVTRDVDGRYVVALPFKSDKPILPENSREIALRRFMSTERRLEANKKLREAYNEVMREYITLQHMELIERDESVKETDKQVYLSHHPVIREDRETTKYRIVYDASCKGSNGVSLNSELLRRTAPPGRRGPAAPAACRCGGRAASQPRARAAPPPPPPPPPAGMRASSDGFSRSSHQNVPFGRKYNKKCEYCGRVHDRFKCPAYGQRCTRCNKANHFARMCRVYMVQENSTDQVSRKSWYEDILIGNTAVSFKLDTGADVNVLPHRFLSRIGIKDVELIQTRTKLTGYSGDPIRVVGKAMLKVVCRGNAYLLKCIIADVDSSPVLGRIACEEMNLVKRVNSLESSVTASSAEILNDFEDVFIGMGCLPGEYKIRLREDARPVVHAPRKLPIALRDSVKKKLDEMLQQGVVAKVEGPTDWVNSMTVVKKANGDLRICLDPRDLNKAIRREHFKLPTLDEITARLAGAKYFSTLDAKASMWRL
ncbi:uncharacterized protein LOC125237342 [Leguminivora glycinivorella]|uniref:uncharacterized protein LOC125237342 n=1 Tax=Leguminivora glycinivorella TaxID=1035111 RepID=UPI00200E29D1|nr:uncharacterized protein LOC125237342 [Leguminivora glycinivorella]